MLNKISSFNFRRPSNASEKTSGPGQPLEHSDTTFFLRKEVQDARGAVEALDKQVTEANSFREKAAEVLAEAHRALSRLEQALSAKKNAQELITVACEIKVAAVRGQTLVKVHGSYSFVGKVVTLVARATINKKFDKVCEKLQKLLPYAEPAPGIPVTNSVEDRVHELTSKVGSLTREEKAEKHIDSTKTYTGVLLRTGKHDRVHALTCYGDSESGCIWWSVNQELEFYSPTSQSTTGFPLEKPTLVVTSIAMDAAGNMWTGHIKGLIRVNRKLSGDYCLEDKCFSVAITAIGFDDKGNAWIGDQSGRIKVVRYDDTLHRLELVSTLQRSQSIDKGSKPKTNPLADHRTPAYLFGTFTAPSKQECTTQSVSVEGPVRCIYVRGNRAWIAGGRYGGWVMQWDAETFNETESWDCGSYGPCHVITSITCLSNQVLIHQHSAGRHTSGSHPDFTQPSTCWRLVTGHENGQLLLWNPEDRLLPLLKIGEHSSPVKGVVAFEEYNILCIAHGNGDMHIFVQPHQELALPSVAQNQPLGQLKPKRVIVKAHKSTLSIMVGGVGMCVTASTLGTVRLWDAKDLHSEAERHGLLHSVPSIPRHLNLSGSSSEYALAALGRGEYVKRTQSVTEMKGNSRHVRNLSNGSADLNVEALDVTPTATARSEASEFNIAVNNIGVQQIDSSEIKLIKLIGSGAYGKVWLAEWTGTNVAAKELVGFQKVMEEGSEGVRQYKREYEALLNEVQLLGSLSHPNIMRFCAVCLNPPMIITQYYSHGSLFDLLKRARKGNAAALKGLSWTKRLDMLRDVAAGMQYLHTRKPSVIHGDLRSPNLLLDLTIETNSPRYHVKIADFGLARMLNQQGNTIAVSKTTNPRWSAPEVIKESKIGKAADVYSFGIIMWEVLTWTQPFEDMLSVQVIFSTVSESNRPELPPDNELPGTPGVTLPAYRELMEKCWAQDQALRPSFEQIVAYIERMRVLEKNHLTNTRNQGSNRVRSEPASGQSSPPAPSSGSNNPKPPYDSAMQPRLPAREDLARDSPPLGRNSAPLARESPKLLQIAGTSPSAPSSISSASNVVISQAEHQSSLEAARTGQFAGSQMMPISEENSGSYVMTEHGLVLDKGKGAYSSNRTSPNGPSNLGPNIGRVAIAAGKPQPYSPFAAAAAGGESALAPVARPMSPFSAAQPAKSPFANQASSSPFAQGGSPFAQSNSAFAQGNSASTPSSPFANGPNNSPFALASHGSGGYHSGPERTPSFSHLGHGAGGERTPSFSHHLSHGTGAERTPSFSHLSHGAVTERTPSYSHLSHVTGPERIPSFGRLSHLGPPERSPSYSHLSHAVTRSPHASGSSSPRNYGMAFVQAGSAPLSDRVSSMENAGSDASRHAYSQDGQQVFPQEYWPTPQPQPAYDDCGGYVNNSSPFAIVANSSFSNLSDETMAAIQEVQQKLAEQQQLESKLTASTSSIHSNDPAPAKGHTGNFYSPFAMMADMGRFSLETTLSGILGPDVGSIAIPVSVVDAPSTSQATVQSPIAVQSPFAVGNTFATGPEPLEPQSQQGASQAQHGPLPVQQEQLLSFSALASVSTGSVATSSGNPLEYARSFATPDSAMRRPSRLVNAGSAGDDVDLAPQNPESTSLSPTPELVSSEMFYSINEGSFNGDESMSSTPQWGSLTNLYSFLPKTPDTTPSRPTFPPPLEGFGSLHHEEPVQQDAMNTMTSTNSSLEHCAATLYDIHNERHTDALQPLLGSQGSESIRRGAPSPGGDNSAASSPRVLPATGSGSGEQPPSPLVNVTAAASSSRASVNSPDGRAGRVSGALPYDEAMMEALLMQRNPIAQYGAHQNQSSRGRTLEVTLSAQSGREQSPVPPGANSPSNFKKIVHSQSATSTVDTHNSSNSIQLPVPSHGSSLPSELPVGYSPVEYRLS